MPLVNVLGTATLTGQLLAARLLELGYEVALDLPATHMAVEVFWSQPGVRLLRAPDPEAEATLEVDPAGGTAITVKAGGRSVVLRRGHQVHVDDFVGYALWAWRRLDEMRPDVEVSEEVVRAWACAWRIRGLWGLF